MSQGLFRFRRAGALLPFVFAALVTTGCAHQPVEAPTPPAKPAGPVVPKPAADLAPGVARYSGAIVANDQRFPIEATRTIEEIDGKWVVTERFKPPSGNEGIESAILEKGTLIVRKRKIAQGPIQAELEFRNGKATGEVGMGEAPTQVSIDLGGELFADGAGAWPSLAALPLAPGYSLLYRVFDVQGRRPATRRASVAGSEAITIPAGRFDCWRVEIVVADETPGKTTIWVAKGSRKIVRSETLLPTGTKVEAELQGEGAAPAPPAAK
jgi:hypothetical protein